jgi:type II secretory pathway component PulK
MRAMLRPLRRRPRSAGIALLLVMVVLLLVATLATEIALTARTHYRLADHAMDDFLLRSVVEGRRNILVAALRHDGSRADNMDTEWDTWSWHGLGDLGAREAWGQAGGTPDDEVRDAADDEAARVYRNRDVTFLAWCQDERSKVNLRGLKWEKDSPTFLQTQETLVRLIDRYRERWPELDVSDSDAREMVNDLVEWLHSAEDTDDDPLPPSKNRQGRLLSLEELLRVPGGRWLPERCYDVRNPKETEEGDFSRTVVASGAADAEEDTGGADDSAWEWANGGSVPGLFRYVTVWGEGTTGNQPKINVNTALRPVLEALLEPGQEELAEAILEHRRAGGNPSETSETSSEETGGWFKQKSDLTKVDGMGDDLGRYPRLDFFAETKSTTFSLRIICRMVTGRVEGGEESDEPRDIKSLYHYREVVQRTQQGTVSLHAERRQDPDFGD